MSKYSKHYSQELKVEVVCRIERGEIDLERVTTEAKIMDAETVQEAAKWLTPKEKILALHDRSLVSLITRLKG